MVEVNMSMKVVVPVLKCLLDKTLLHTRIYGCLISLGRIKRIGEAGRK